MSLLQETPPRATRYPQPNSDTCFICGRSNPVGLQMTFFDNGVDEVYAEHTVPDLYQSYPGLVHGGIVTAMLDENNFATLYRYDAQGILIGTLKETERGVITVQETRAFTPVTDFSVR